MKDYLKKVGSDKPDILLLDIGLPEDSGLYLIKKLKHPTCEDDDRLLK